MSEEKIYAEEYVPAQSELNAALGNFKAACDKLGFDFRVRLEDEVYEFIEGN